MSNNEAKFQASFVALHVYAGVLAAIAVVLHFTAACVPRAAAQGAEQLDPHRAVRHGPAAQS